MGLLYPSETSESTRITPAPRAPTRPVTSPKIDCTLFGLPRIVVAPPVIGRIARLLYGWLVQRVPFTLYEVFDQLTFTGCGTGTL